MLTLRQQIEESMKESAGNPAARGMPPQMPMQGAGGPAPAGSASGGMGGPAGSASGGMPPGAPMQQQMMGPEGAPQSPMGPAEMPPQGPSMGPSTVGGMQAPGMEQAPAPWAGMQQAQMQSKPLMQGQGGSEIQALIQRLRSPENALQRMAGQQRMAQVR